MKMEYSVIDLFFLPSFVNKEFLLTLNPLYIFPIISVIFCMCIIYAFGIKSSVQPPSFKDIVDDKKTNKKRKKDTSKKGQGKVLNEKSTDSDSNLLHGVSDKKRIPKKAVSDDIDSVTAIKKKGQEKDQNEKIADNASNLLHGIPDKKKTGKKATLDDTDLVSSVKKATKKIQGKERPKKEITVQKEIVHKEDSVEDGWVQLTSKKGRKAQKKIEAKCEEESNIKLQTEKKLGMFEEKQLDKELPKKDNENFLERELPKIQNVKDSENELPKIQNAKPLDIELPKVQNDKYLDKELQRTQKENLKTVKPEGNETVKESKGSKNKVKATVEETKTSTDVLKSSSVGLKIKKTKDQDHTVKEPKVESSSSLNNSVENVKNGTQSVSSVSDSVKEESRSSSSQVDLSSTDETTLVPISNGDKDTLNKQPTSTNVVFDELAGLYPEVKEQRKKKKVRRDH